MDIFELMKSRHSVRQFQEKAIAPEVRQQLDAYAAELNASSGLHMQVVYDEPECFGTRLAHYGRFENARNYISLVGRKSADLDELCGYYGELMVLKAQELGLNTCWVALTHGKSHAVVADGERETIVIALGYGVSQGTARRSKTMQQVSNATANSPQWFIRGVEAAMLAPTAMNQQKFKFVLSDKGVEVKTPLLGAYLKLDCGIVKCHFELVAGKENFTFVK
ncbi:MAG: nitroreductase [Bacteroidales bacterium]|nr:nitroreductase [Bacteroidales bacterium]